MALKKTAMKSMSKTTAPAKKQSDSKEEKNNIAAALFAQPVSGATSVDEFTVYVDCADIVPNPLNKEKISNIEEMKASIELAGEVMHNLVVKDKNEDGKYMLIAGERRWTAVCQLVAEGKEQYRELPCHIQDMTALGEEALKMPEEWRERYLIETSNVENRRDSEMAETMGRIDRTRQLFMEMKDAGVKPRGSIRDLIARTLGLDSRTVANYEMLSRKATDEVKEAISEGKISYRGAMEISQNEPEEQNKILEKAEQLREQKIAEAADQKEMEKAKKPLSEKDIEVASVETFSSMETNTEESDSDIDYEDVSGDNMPAKPKKQAVVIPDEEIKEVENKLSKMLDKCEGLQGREFPPSVYNTIQKNIKIVSDAVQTLVSIIGESNR